MAPAAISQGAQASPTPAPQPSTPTSPGSKQFDDVFHAKFMYIIGEWKNDPSRGQLTQKDRKVFIETAYAETDEQFFGKRQLTTEENRLRALTKVFYKVLAEEPWSEDWIRAPDVERKLSKFEMHKDSIALARAHGLTTPRDAVKAAREAALKQQELAKKASESSDASKDLKIDAGPFDEIEIIYIAGTVSSTATNRISRENIYPVSVSSVANVLQNHICRDMVRPYSMAESFINCTDTKKLEEMRRFACNVCDFAPHLLDNDNVSLLVVLLILSRSDCCRRFENNGIRIEGSTISHRKAECMKNKMGWRTAEEKKPFDQFANEFQLRVKNACFPPLQRPQGRATGRKSMAAARKGSTPNTPGTSGVYAQGPPMGYMAPPVAASGSRSGNGNGMAGGPSNGMASGSGLANAPAQQTVFAQPPMVTSPAVKETAPKSPVVKEPPAKSPITKSPAPKASRSRASTSLASSAPEPMEVD